MSMFSWLGRKSLKRELTVDKGPQIGDVYELDDKNPFDSFSVVIKDVRDGYVQYRFSGTEKLWSMKASVFRGTYKKRQDAA